MKPRALHIVSTPSLRRTTSLRFFPMGLRHYAGWGYVFNLSTQEAEDLCEFKASLILGQGYIEKSCLNKQTKVNKIHIIQYIKINAKL